MIDILFVSFNRLEMTRESFTAFLNNTEWLIREPIQQRVGTVYVLDDASTDGTAEWLQEVIGAHTHRSLFHFHGEQFGGPVAAMNWYLDNSDPDIDTFCKLDNDFVVPPGWFREMSLIHFLEPGTSIIGFEPMSHGVEPCHYPHRILEPAKWIGGKGFIRKRAFGYCRPSPNGQRGYGGFTEWQAQHEHVTKAWVTPDLPAFGLDQLCFEPWLSLTEKYVAEGWQRAWPKYDPSMRNYWEWFTPVHVANASVKGAA